MIIDASVRVDTPTRSVLTVGHVYQAVVKALGVNDGASFDALMAALSLNEPEGLGSQSMADPTLIHPADAVSRLREFVEAESGGAAAASSIGLAGQLLLLPSRQGQAKLR